MKLTSLIKTLIAGMLVLSFGCKTIAPPAVTTTTTSPGQIKTMATANPMPVPSPLAASLLIARQQEEAGNYVDAIGILENIVAEQGDIPEALHRLGLIHSKMGRLDLAKPYFEKAVHLAPQNAELLADYGFFNFVTDDWASAEQYYQRSLSLNPKLQRAHNNFAILLAKTNRVDLARSHFKWAGIDDSAIRENIRLANNEFPGEVQQPLTQVMPQPMPETQVPDGMNRLQNPFFYAKKLEPKRLPKKAEVVEKDDEKMEITVVQTAYLEKANDESFLLPWVESCADEPNPYFDEPDTEPVEIASGSQDNNRK